MRLSRDTSGTFDQAKDSLQRDLVALQRAFDQQQGQITAQGLLISALTARLANPATTIAANGQVAGGGLRVVTHDQTLIGQGTPSNPLRVLTANVAPAQNILTATVPITAVSTFTGMGTSYAAGITMVTGVAGYAIMPILMTVNWTQANGGAFAPFSTASTFRLANNTGGNSVLDTTATPNSPTNGDYGVWALGIGRTWGANSAGTLNNGKDLRLYSLATWVYGASATTTFTGGSFRLYYVLAQLT